MDTGLRVGIDGRLAAVGAGQVNAALDSMKAKAISTTNVMNDRWKAMTGHIFNVRSAILSMGAGMTATLATSIIVNFEQSMANVAAISGATKDEMAALSDTARKLGAATAYSAAQAGEGFEFLARAGFNAQRAIKAMPVVLNLAAAANLTLARSAEITANVMAGFKLDAEGASQAADVLATIASRTNTDVSSMAEGMKYVGPIATAVGYSIEETAAALGALSDAGLAGSMAGTGLRKVISSLAAPTQEAIKIFKSWGYTVSDLDPKTNSIIDIMKKLKAANMDAGQALSIFSDRGGTAAVVLTEMIPKIQYITDALDGSAGAATRMANVMSNTLKNAFSNLSGAVEELYLMAGEGGLKGALRDLTDTMTAFVQHLNGSLDPLDKNAAAIKNLTEVLRALMALAIFAFLTKVTAAFLSFVVAVGSAITAMATAKLGLFAFITPVTAVAAAIAALVTGIVIYKNELLALIGIQTRAKNGMDDMASMGEAIKLAEWVQPYADAKQKVMDLEKELKNAQESLDEMNAARNKGLGRLAALYVPGVASKQADTVNALRDRINSLTDRLGAAKSELQSFVSVVTQGGDVMEHVNGYVDQTTEAIENLGTAAVDTTEEEDKAAKAAQKIADSYNATIRELQLRVANQRTLTDSLGKGKEAEIQARIEISAREAAESIGILTSDKRYETLRSLIDVLTREEEKTRETTQAIEAKQEAEQRAMQLMAELTTASKSGIDQVIGKWKEYDEVLKAIELTEEQRAAAAKVRAADLRQATINQMDSWEAVKYSVEDMTKEATNGYKNSVELIQDMNGILTNSLTDLFVNGTMNIKALEKEVLTSITRMIIKAELAKATMSVMGWLNPGSIAGSMGGGGLIGNLFSGGGPKPFAQAGTPGFADGGISTSPGLAFVSEGAHRVEAHVPLPNGRSIPVEMKNSGRSNTTVNFHISTPDADSFRASQSQLMEKAYVAGMQNRIRNGK